MFSLLNSDNNIHKIGAIFSIDKLIKGEFDEDTNTKITRFNYLRLSLASKETKVIEYSAKALGSFSTLNEIFIIESVTLEIQRALEGIRSSSNSSIEKKKGSILVLIEISKNAPQLFHPFLTEYLSSIWDTMRDADLEIRKLSSLSLRFALQVVSDRVKNSIQSSNENLLNFYLQALKSLENQNRYWKHASLLAVGELLINNFCKPFILQNLQEIYSKVISLRDSKDKFIKTQVFNLIPFLSRVDPTLFSKVFFYFSFSSFLTVFKNFLKQYFEVCVACLTLSSKKDNELWGSSLISLGNLSLVFFSPFIIMMIIIFIIIISIIIIIIIIIIFLFYLFFYIIIIVMIIIIIFFIFI